MRFACLHAHTQEGGNLPPGKWCTACGKKIVRRGSPRDERLDRERREQAFGRKMQRLQLSLHRKADDGA